MRRTILLMLAGAATLSACAWDDFDYGRPGYGGYAYAGDAWRDRRPYAGSLRGPGVETLDPWLRDTDEGRAIVTLGFRDAGAGFVSEDTAHRANIWFRRYADENRDMRVTDPEIRTALVAAARRHLR